MAAPPGSARVDLWPIAVEEYLIQTDHGDAPAQLYSPQQKKKNRRCCTGRQPAWHIALDRCARGTWPGWPGAFCQPGSVQAIGMTLLRHRLMLSLKAGLPASMTGTGFKTCWSIVAVVWNMKPKAPGLPRFTSASRICLEAPALPAAAAVFAGRCVPAAVGQAVHPPARSWLDFDQVVATSLARYPQASTASYRA